MRRSVEGLYAAAKEVLFGSKVIGTDERAPAGAATTPGPAHSGQPAPVSYWRFRRMCCPRVQRAVSRYALKNKALTRDSEDGNLEVDN
jgi:hypothetical protein